MSAAAREAMLSCATAPDGDIGEAALWLAAEDLDAVDVPRWLALLDELAEELRTRGAGEAPASAVAALLGALLRDRLNLHGAGGADPSAHYLPSVLERGRGVPIACSAVWMAVGRRAGVAISGVGLPGHFAVRCGGQLVDPFAGGELLDDDCARRLVGRANGGEPVAIDPAWLAPVTLPVMLARMSRNLRGCYASLNRWDQALRAADRCVALLPGEPGERRDRGLLNWRLGRSAAALCDLRAYLEAAPATAPDRARIDDVVSRLRASLN